MHKGFPWATQRAWKEDQTCGQRESEEEDNSNYIGEWLNVSKTPPRHRCFESGYIFCSTKEKWK